MIEFIETWRAYANKADTYRRWQYQAGAGIFTPGEMLMQGSGVGYCNARIRPTDRVRIGFKHRCLQRPPSVTNSSFLHLPNGGETNTFNQVGLGMNPDGTVSIFYGSNFSGLGGLTLGNGTKVLDIDSEHWIELDVGLSLTTTGWVELRIDGDLELSFAGIRTSARPTAVVDRVTICGGANVSKHAFSDMYVGNGDEGWMGPSDAALIPFAPQAGSFIAGDIEVLTPANAPPLPPIVPTFPAGTYTGLMQGPSGDPVPVTLTMPAVTP